MDYSFFNVVVEISKENEEKAQKLIDSLGNPINPELRDIVDNLNSIHFFSINLIPGDKNDAPFIVFESTLDGEGHATLNKLANKAAKFLTPVFALADDFSEHKNLAEFWRAKRIETGLGYRDTPGLAHPGTPKLTVKRIKQEDQLAQNLIQRYEKTPWQGSALATFETIKTQTLENKHFAWAKTALPCPLLEASRPGTPLETILKSLPSLTTTLLWPAIIIAMVIASFIAFPNFGSPINFFFTFIKYLICAASLSVGFSLVFIAFVYFKLRQLENTDKSADSAPSHKLLDNIRSREDHSYQNHMACVSILKSGLIRQITLRFIFWHIAILTTRLFQPGFLGAIGTIHFARWFVIPGTNKLLFFSNYGGSWESYLEDFITKAASGLTGVWSNTLDFPKTSHLILEGARNGDRFKRWARRQQIPSYCWYNAYPLLTTENIRKNAALRQGIANIKTEAQARDWLSLFGSSPLPNDELQSGNIQSLMFGGFGPMPEAKMLAFQLSASNTDKTKAWLKNIIPTLRFGDKRPKDEEQIRILALSASGLKKLGLDQESLNQFPHAFASGMSARAKILGDYENNAPEHWLWGGAKPVDAVILIYAKNKDLLESACTQTSEEIATYEGSIVHQLPLRSLPPKGTPMREPFGFVDGVSQPIIRGIGKHKAGLNPLHLVEPGEFILGYPNGRGHYPQSPSIPATKDQKNKLYPVLSNIDRQKPNFSSQNNNALKDLGKDGSFLVLRQLEQDVDAFDKYCQTAANELSEQHPKKGITPEWVGAKMIGRWKDGSSLVRHPDKPASDTNNNTKPDNDFLFGKEDAQGLRCPFGSHIRRTNPRESQDRKSKEQISITNRRRIMRVGRVYEENKKQGLLFACLNGDIERQFEFIQQSWINNPSFHGLNKEVDPLFNNESSSGSYAIPTENKTLCVKGISQLITMRGGEYFFLPGLATLRFLSESSK